MNSERGKKFMLLGGKKYRPEKRPLLIVISVSIFLE
jgi:hypothetical protein